MVFCLLFSLSLNSGPCPLSLWWIIIYPSRPNQQETNVPLSSVTAHVQGPWEQTRVAVEGWAAQSNRPGFSPNSATVTRMILGIHVSPSGLSPLTYKAELVIITGVFPECREN